MRFESLFDTNLAEYNSKQLSLPAATPRYIETTVRDQSADEAETITIEYKSLPFARTKMLEIPVKHARVLCDGDDVKKSMEITFDLKDHGVPFLPGDTIGIQPTNRTEDVNFLLDTLGLASQSDALVDLSIMNATKKKGAKIPVYMPQTTTYNNILSRYLNIYSVPKKLLIRALVEFTENEHQRQILRVLCSKEGAEIYNQRVIAPGINFVELMRRLPSCKPPLGILIEHLPRLLTRPYSIANSPLATPDELKIVFSILSDNSRRGLTTEQLEHKVEMFLCDKNTSCTMNFYFREENNFKYTEDDLNKNVVMIGVGCAVAPFIGFLQHKFELQRNTNKRKSTASTTWLFSGSRYCENALYSEEIKEFMKLGVIDEYFESFSREPDYPFKYVQEQLRANAEEFVKMILLPETKVYVCADGNDISKAIAAAVVDMIKTVCNSTAEEANEIFNGLRTSGRYIEDVWL